MRRRRCRTYRRYCRKISVNEKSLLRAYPVKAILPAILKLGVRKLPATIMPTGIISQSAFIFRKMIKVIYSLNPEIM
jgi:hypothetical protein